MCSQPQPPEQLAMLDCPQRPGSRGISINHLARRRGVGWGDDDRRPRDALPGRRQRPFGAQRRGLAGDRRSRRQAPASAHEDAQDGRDRAHATRRRRDRHHGREGGRGGALRRRRLRRRGDRISGDGRREVGQDRRTCRACADSGQRREPDRGARPLGLRGGGRRDPRRLAGCGQRPRPLRRARRAARSPDRARAARA